MSSPEAWDTTLASSIHPGGRYAEIVSSRAARGHRVTVTAPTVLESVRGLASRVRDEPRLGPALLWYRRLPFADAVRVLPFDGPAAVLAGELQARQPLPPLARRSDRRGKPQRRVAWMLDAQIAATAWTAGYAVATENRGDFERLAELIADLYPSGAPLEVVGPRAG